MKIVIFGLTISSSWGNGHATLWRGLCRALVARGHEIVFFERDVPYYAEHRDLAELPGGRLVLFPAWDEVIETARRELADADVAITTSYCPDALAAGVLMQDSPALRVFYDLDAPVTLARLDAGEEVGYLDERGLRDFDLTLSYTGGMALERLQSRLGATRVAPLYGHVDPAIHRPVPVVGAYRCDLSYLGTYAEDRQALLERLFIEPARQRRAQRFLIGGAKYPDDFPWAPNIFFVRHLPPAEHPAFFCSSRLTLNITRAAMAAMGYCPSGRLFEAAACGAPLLSDQWTGVDEFFEPGREICVVEKPEDVLAALELSDAELARMAAAARERVFAEHTSAHRAEELERLLEEAICTAPTPA
jgi:spore maturation protein CgeB